MTMVIYCTLKEHGEEINYLVIYSRPRHNKN